ncbi:hypothetical protein [Paraburkholderia heleia]|uniref:hypothetical protein n=1 Tax=Paraburkholderia heleia TaxID=634127 RepID=UPI002AB78030|nr:hypothetical protein [Paraburkholderia heleia]
MNFDVMEFIKEADLSSMTVDDPDYTLWPHLFIKRKFTDAELAEHWRTYQAKPVYDYGSRGPAYDEDNDVSNTINRYTPVAGEVTVKPRHDLAVTGWALNKHSSPVSVVKPDQWIDIQTGEIVTRSELRASNTYIPTPVSNSDRLIKNLTLLASCGNPDTDKGKHNRAFIRFILQSRNGRGGFLQPLNAVLDRWIAYAHTDIRTNHKARKREQLKGLLYKLGVLHDEQTLTKPYQVLKQSTRRENLGDASKAAIVLKPRAKPGMGVLACS